MHKGKHLVKPIMLICSDGYIIDDFGSYNAAENNATIEELFETKKALFWQTLQKQSCITT